MSWVVYSRFWLWDTSWSVHYYLQYRLRLSEEEEEKKLLICTIWYHHKTKLCTIYRKSKVDRVKFSAVSKLSKSWCQVLSQSSWSTSRGHIEAQNLHTSRKTKRFLHDFSACMYRMCTGLPLFSLQCAHELTFPHHWPLQTSRNAWLSFVENVCIVFETSSPPLFLNFFIGFW